MGERKMGEGKMGEGKMGEGKMGERGGEGRVRCKGEGEEGRREEWGRG